MDKQPKNELREAAERLSNLANGLARRYGAPPAIHLLLSTALSLALANMPKADAVAWLREMADNLEADAPPRAN